MKRNIWVKVLAFFVLFWILLSVVWTAFLILFSPKQQITTEKTLTSEELNKLLESSKTEVISWTWSETSTWKTK